jgi:predicted RNA binding protein YcfA (HicA-like mRNA interferase family)
MPGTSTPKSLRRQAASPSITPRRVECASTVLPLPAEIATCPIALPAADAWFLVRTKGSHRQYHHPTKPGSVSVSGKLSVDVPIGTLNGVLRQAGLKK